MRTKIVIVALILASLIVGWHVYYPSGTWRYKMTVTVETPEGLKSGSAVREIYASSYPRFLSAGRNASIELQKGEAVVVDLGERGILLALLSGPMNFTDHAIWVPFFTFPGPCGYLSKCGIRYYSSLKSVSSQKLPPEYYPAFVGLKTKIGQNMLKPVLETRLCKNPVTGIPNSQICIIKDHFVELFGEGVRLLSVQIEMTETFSTQDMLPKIIPLLKGQGFSNEHFRI